MQKILLRLSGVCNWLIFLELLFAFWSLFNIFPMIDHHRINWLTWAGFAFYSILLYLIVTLKNKVVAFRDLEEAKLIGVDPSAIVPTRFGILLMVLFGVHVLVALNMAGISISDVLYLFQYFSGKNVFFFVLYFILPLGVVINGIRLIILLIRLMRLKTSMPKTGNIGV